MDCKTLLLETNLGERDPVIQKFIKSHRSLHWVAEDVNFKRDYTQFCSLSEEEQKFILNISVFFLISDKIITDNIEYYSNSIPLIEAKEFYAVQNSMEFVHVDVYGKQILCITNNKDINYYSDLISNMKSVVKKRDFCKQLNSGEIPFEEKLLTNAFIEAVFFSASFSGILWFNQRGKLSGIGSANEWIRRDENLHWLFGAYMSKKYYPVSLEKIYEIARNVYKIEEEFIEDILKKDLGSMTIKSLKIYAKYCVNEVLLALEVPILYKEANINPFDYMEKLNLQVKPNFFEVTSSNYQNPILSNKYKFRIEEELEY
jgi:ribonucleoside-diphosphate reductase subunit M2